MALDIVANPVTLEFNELTNPVDVIILPVAVTVVVAILAILAFAATVKLANALVKIRLPLPEIC